MGLRIIKMGLLTFFALNAYAINWWKTADQKAYMAYQHQQYQKAITLFKRADWRGVAAFRQKNYAEAIRSFAELTSAEGFYNLGTALAFQGDYDNAIKVYYKTLSIEPGHADAKYNLAILEKMKQDQKQPQNPEQQKAKNKKQDQDRPQDEPKDQENKQKSASKKQQTQEQQKKVQSKANKQQQAQEGQWLKLIEDDPAGLLKQKFLRDYQREVEEGKA